MEEEYRTGSRGEEAGNGEGANRRMSSDNAIISSYAKDLGVD
jgi:hypothetical protein